MSLVIAIKDNDRIVLGADKQASIGDSKEHTFTKLWDVIGLNGAVMGGVGTARASQILQYWNIIDKNYLDEKGEFDTDYVVNVLTQNIVEALKANGVVVEDDKGVIIPNSFIFAYKDRAWMIYSDLSVGEIDDTLAIGSGSEIAKGVLYATKDKSPFERIITSIQAASENTLYVDDNVDLFTTVAVDGDEEVLQDLGILPPVEVTLEEPEPEEGLVDVEEKSTPKPAHKSKNKSDKKKHTNKNNKKKPKEKQ